MPKYRKWQDLEHAQTIKFKKSKISESWKSPFEVVVVFFIFEFGVFSRFQHLDDLSILRFLHFRRLCNLHDFGHSDTFNVLKFSLYNSSQGYTGLGFERASMKISLSQSQVEHSAWRMFFEVHSLSRSTHPRYTENCNFRCFEKARFYFPSTVSRKTCWLKVTENCIYWFPEQLS